MVKVITYPDRQKLLQLALGIRTRLRYEFLRHPTKYKIDYRKVYINDYKTNTDEMKLTLIVGGHLYEFPTIPTCGWICGHDKLTSDNELRLLLTTTAFQNVIKCRNSEFGVYNPDESILLNDINVYKQKIVTNLLKVCAKE